MKRRRMKIFAACTVAISALGIASAVEFAPRLVWNASASAPIGLYRIERRVPEIGDFALVELGPALEKFIAGRHYLPADIPLLKRVAALPGDEICRDGEAIFINKTFVAEARKFDSEGRILPSWSGCFTLHSGEFFLLNDHEKSLDGRYFGATMAEDVIGVAVPVWIRESAR